MSKRELQPVNKRAAFVLFPFFFCLAAALPAWGRKEIKKNEVQIEMKESKPVQESQNVLVQISGRVRLVGTSLFFELVITGHDCEWYVDKEDEQKLMDFQQRAITVEGLETVMALKLANGHPAGERRMLKDIKIINVE
jgi:hypothetical protein